MMNVSMFMTTCIMSIIPFMAHTHQQCTHRGCLFGEVGPSSFCSWHRYIWINSGMCGTLSESLILNFINELVHYFCLFYISVECYGYFLLITIYYFCFKTCISEFLSISNKCKVYKKSQYLKNYWYLIFKKWYQEANHIFWDMMSKCSNIWNCLYHSNLD